MPKNHEEKIHTPPLTAGREEHERRWLEGVLGGQQDSAVVHAPLEVRVFGSEDGEVPLEDVVLDGFRVVSVRRRVRVGAHLLHLLHDSLNGWILHVELGGGGRGRGGRAGARHVVRASLCSFALDCALLVGVAARPGGVGAGQLLSRVFFGARRLPSHSDAVRSVSRCYECFGLLPVLCRDEEQVSLGRDDGAWMKRWTHALRKETRDVEHVLVNGVMSIPPPTLAGENACRRRRGDLSDDVRGVLIVRAED